MKRAARSLFASLVAGSVLFGWNLGCPEWLKQATSDAWNYNEHTALLNQNRQLSHDLDEQGRLVFQRLSLKLMISQQLIDGRVTLATATEQFLDLNRMEPAIAEQTHRRFAGDDEEQSSAIQAINFVRSALDRDPARCREIVCHLEMERREMNATPHDSLH